MRKAYSKNHGALYDASNRVLRFLQCGFDLGKIGDVDLGVFDCATKRSTIGDDILRSVVRTTTSRHGDNILGAMFSEVDGKASTETLETSDDGVRCFRI